MEKEQKLRQDLEKSFQDQRIELENLCKALQSNEMQKEEVQQQIKNLLNQKDQIKARYFHELQKVQQTQLLQLEYWEEELQEMSKKYRQAREENEEMKEQLEALQALLEAQKKELSGYKMQQDQNRRIKRQLSNLQASLDSSQEESIHSKRETFISQDHFNHKILSILKNQKSGKSLELELEELKKIWQAEVAQRLQLSDQKRSSPAFIFELTL